MVHPADLGLALRRSLDPEPAPEPMPGDRLAAVLVPLIEGPAPSLVFTVRAADLSRHPGEISFPGGLQDAGESLRETALREAAEEIGLSSSDVQVLGGLPPVHTTVSGILVVPFVGMLSAAPSLTLSAAEIAEVLIFPIADLDRAEEPVSYERPGGGTWHGFAYPMGAHTIWGATGWMLHALLERWREVVGSGRRRSVEP